MLGLMNAATKAGQPPLEVLLKAYTRHLHVPKE
jgi:hypothetical protein